MNFTKGDIVKVIDKYETYNGYTDMFYAIAEQEGLNVRITEKELDRNCSDLQDGTKGIVLGAKKHLSFPDEGNVVLLEVIPSGKLVLINEEGISLTPMKIIK